MPKDELIKLTERDHIKNVLSKIKIKEVMDTPVPTVFEDDELSEVQGKFISHKTFYLPVLSRNFTLVGLISQKYLYKTQSPRKFVDPQVKFDPEIAQAKDILVDEDSFYFREALDSYILRNIMHKSPTTLNPEATVAEALMLMGRKNIGCIVVVDKNQKVQGLLTHKEIVDLLVHLIV